MAEQTRKVVKRRRVRYFYVKVDGEPHVHKILHINRGKDIVTAWDYRDAKRKMYALSDVKKTMQHAYSMTEVAEMLNRHRLTLHRHLWKGRYVRPQQIYNLQSRKPGKFMLSEDDVLDLHEALCEVHRGKARLDGNITQAKGFPDRATIRSLVQQARVLYTLDDDGNPIPIWKEQVW